MVEAHEERFQGGAQARVVPVDHNFGQGVLAAHLLNKDTVLIIDTLYHTTLHSLFCPFLCRFGLYFHDVHRHT